MSGSDVLPLWTPVESPAGRLDVGWSAPLPTGATRAAVIVSLRSVADADVALFWAGDLDGDLIRQPVEVGARTATLWVPSGRPLWLALVASDGSGRPLPCPAVSLLAPVEADGEPGSPQGRLRPRALEGPVAHDHVASSLPELVFVEQAGHTPPDLDALARRVAERAAGDAPVTPAAAAHGAARGGFGARQRWYLTRLGWPRPSGDEPRALVRRQTFITAEDAASWRDALPDDATPVADGADGLVDAVTAADKTAFYVVLTGPAPWVPLPVAPVPPPFSACRHPMLLGDVVSQLSGTIQARVAELEEGPLALGDVEPLLMLLDAAARVLPPTDPAQQCLAEARLRWAPGHRMA